MFWFYKFTSGSDELIIVLIHLIVIGDISVLLCFVVDYVKEK